MSVAQKTSVADPGGGGGGKGGANAPPFEGLPSRVLSKSAPRNVTTYTTAPGGVGQAHVHSDIMRCSLY